MSASDLKRAIPPQSTTAVATKAMNGLDAKKLMLGSGVRPGCVVPAELICVGGAATWLGGLEAGRPGTPVSGMDGAGEAVRGLER